MICRYALPFSLSYLALAVPSIAMAQGSQALPATTITATRMPGTVAEIAGSVQRIESAQIQQQAAAGRKLADVVGQLVPSMGASSGTASNYGQTMRGRQIQVLIDGVPHTGSRDVARQLNSISPDSIDYIEVLSGASSLYGAGATGGIINIVTRQSEGGPLAFRSKVGLSAADNLKKDSLRKEFAQSLSFASGAVDGYFGVNYTERGSLYDANGDRIAPEPAQVGRNDTDTLDLNGRMNFQLGDQQKLTVTAQRFHDKQDSDYAPDYGPGLAVLLNPAYAPSLEAVKGLVLNDQPHTKRDRLGLTYQNQDVLGQRLTAEAYYRKEESRFYPFATPYSINNAVPTILALPISNAQKQQLAQQMQANAIAVLQSESEAEVAGLRLAMQSSPEVAGLPVQLVYGVDYENESVSQTADSFSLATFMMSNGLVHQPTGRSYGYGPDVDIDKLGVFLQSRIPLTDALTLQSGVRHETIRSRSDAFTPASEALLADLSGAFGFNYQAGQVDSGSVRHRATLFNLGLVYDLNDEQQLFTNFSQGFSLPDMQRVLRDVPAGFVVNSRNVDPIKVNSLEAGWRFGGADGLSGSFTAFVNTSDKVVQFQRDYSVSVADTDERIYGAEGSLAWQFAPRWSAGGSLAYTRGQFKDTAGDWRHLNAFRVSPFKATAFAAWDTEGYGARLQALGISGSDRAFKDAQRASFDNNVRPTSAAQIQGYVVTDLLTYADLPVGRMEFGIYNLLNKEYRSVYSQEAVATYGAMSGIPAEGRTFALSYSLTY